MCKFEPGCWCRCSVLLLCLLVLRLGAWRVVVVVVVMVVRLEGWVQMPLQGALCAGAGTAAMAACRCSCRVRLQGAAHKSFCYLKSMPMLAYFPSGTMSFFSTAFSLYTPAAVDAFFRFETNFSLNVMRRNTMFCCASSHEN